MFGRFNIVATLASLSILSACSSSQPVSQAGPSVVPAARGAGAAQPAKDCNGSHGVKVTPCPITLTRRNKAGVVVTVGGPGVVNSYLTKLNSCFNHKICYNAQREGSSQVQWRISPGLACGAADIEFVGIDAGSQEVGHAFLKSANKYCPHH
jgi:hypothetical protein